MENNVYNLIAKVAYTLSKTGIAKGQKNTPGAGYNFRGIDDIYNVVGPLIADAGLVIVPLCLEREVTERTSNQGKALFYVSVKMAFDIISSYDGSNHKAIMYGEAMDSGDKATNKAMSAAYKYLMLQLFCIPTVGDNDADATTHEVMVELLDDEDVKHIIEACNEYNVEVRQIQKYYNGKELKEIPKSQYEKIMRSLYNSSSSKVNDHVERSSDH